jgi:hypothetical protein
MNIKKIGITALAASLVSVSANSAGGANSFYTLFQKWLKV